MSTEVPSGPDPLPSSPRYRLDPVFVHARRETAIIIGLCLFFLTFTLIVCSLWGYDRSATQVAQVSITFGMPTWAFWGLLVPWIAVNVMTIVFCYVWLADDDLSDPEEEAMLRRLEAHPELDDDSFSSGRRGDA